MSRDIDPEELVTRRRAKADRNGSGRHRAAGPDELTIVGDLDDTDQSTAPVPLVTGRPAVKRVPGSHMDPGLRRKR